MIQELANALQPYSVKDLLSKVGGLHLLPENASRAIRLDSLAHAAASIPHDESKPIISSGSFRRIVNDHLGPSSPAGLMDDPAEQLVTEELIFHGGSYVVFPSANSEATKILRWLFKATTLGKSQVGDQSFRDHVVTLAIACLTVSDEIAKRAGLSRGLSPNEDKDQNLKVPDGPTLKKLSSAVRFETSEIHELLSSRGLLSSELEPLTISSGEVAISKYEFSGDKLHVTPFVRCANTIVIPEPGALLTALRHRILCLADERNILEELAVAYHEAVWNHVREVVDYWQVLEVAIDLPKKAAESSLNTHFSEAVFALDSDKALYLQLVTDPLSEFSADTAFGNWNSRSLADDLENRQLEVAEYLKARESSPEGVLILTLVAGIGRFFVLGFGRHNLPDSLRLMLTASDLEVIAQVEAGDQLALWKFARASRDIRARVDITTTSSLDEFQLYRSQEHSYYISDQKLPTGIFIVPGMGLNLRKEANQRFDSHGISSFHRNSLDEVWRLLGEEIPIYAPPSTMGKRPAVVVDGVFSRPFWVVGPSGVRGDLYSFAAQFAETVAYWLWQLAPFLEDPLSAIDSEIRRFSLYFGYTDDDAMQATLMNVSYTSEPIEGLIQLSDIEAHEGDICITVNHSLIEVLGGSDNAGERRLVLELIQTIRDGFGTVNPVILELLSDTKIKEAIDIYAPLGQKKKLVLLPVGNRPELDPVGIPKYRGIQEAEYGEILDGLGESLRAKGWKEGPVPKDSCVQILGQAAGHLYEELENLVATLRREELLPAMIAYHEAAIRELFLKYLTIPTRLACFGRHEELVKMLSKEMPDVSAANNAIRFLIEYVAARPPSGSKSLSLETYDRLLGLAEQIVGWGSISDLIHFEITDIPLVILPSGRLGRKQTSLTDSRNRFLPQQMEEEINRTRRSFPSHWNIPIQNGVAETDNEIPPELVELDAAFAGEFNLGLWDLENLMFKLYEIGANQNGDAVKKFPMFTLKKLLRESLSWSAYKVGTAIDLLSLKARDDFLNPPGVGKEEVYPWRFNRALSYMRRPLVMAEVDGLEYVMWGNRHLIHSSRYIFELAYGGRLKAKSKKLISIITRFRDQEAKAFEDEIADVIEAQPGSVVRKRVKKFGSLRMLGKDGNDLGDIDVLVAFPDLGLLVPIECKDLALARTPREISNQLTQLFKGDAGQAPTTVKHMRRVNWLQEHLNEVLSALNLPTSIDWKVKPLMISDTEMYTAYLTESPFPVISMSRIRSQVLTELI